MSVLLYDCTTSNKMLEKKVSWELHKNTAYCFEQILEAALYKIAAVPLLSQTIQARHAGHCWGSKEELISDVLLWTPSHERTNVGQPTKTYIHQLCRDTRCHLEDLPRVMTNKDRWKKRLQRIKPGSMPWWSSRYIYIYLRLTDWFYSMLNLIGLFNTSSGFRGDLGVMAIKEYSTFTKAPGLKRHEQKI